MSHPNHSRAYTHETELVETAEDHGFEAERAYASVGESLVGSDGERLTEDVDVVVRRALPGGEDFYIQAKRRKRDNFASYLLPPDGGIVWLKEPGLFVLPDDYLFSVLSGEREPDLLTLPVRTETRSRVAQYIQPDEGAHAQAVRRDHDLTSYMVLPAGLTRELLCKSGEVGGREDQDSQIYNKGVRETLRALEKQGQDLLKDT
jgi:hypothetical protein